jgi:hypothetical protein
MIWIAGFSAVVIALAAFVVFMRAMPGASYRGSPPPLGAGETAIRRALERHVAVLAGEIGERNLWHGEALERARAYIARELSGLGYEVRAQDYEVWGRRVANLDADLAGRASAQEILLLGAHYDSVLGCPGAGDNASGVAALLELARILREFRLDRTVRFAAFVNEEPPFFFTSRMGSLVYARAQRRAGTRIAAMFSLETIGYYSDAPGSQRYPFPLRGLYPDRGCFIAFVGNLASRRLVRRSIGAFRLEARLPSEGIAAPGYLPGVFWSDQWAFWRQGYRAVMITDTAPFRYPFYHTPEDTPDKLDYDRMAYLVAGLAGMVRRLAGR